VTAHTSGSLTPRLCLRAWRLADGGGLLRRATPPAGPARRGTGQGWPRAALRVPSGDGKRCL